MFHITDKNSIQVVEMLVTKNSPCKNYPHPHDHTRLRAKYSYVQTINFTLVFLSVCLSVCMFVSVCLSVMAVTAVTLSLS